MVVLKETGGDDHSITNLEVSVASNSEKMDPEIGKIEKSSRRRKKSVQKAAFTTGKYLRNLAVKPLRNSIIIYPWFIV